MAPIWNPRAVLGLQTGHNPWYCVGTMSSPTGTRRCKRIISASELDRVFKLLDVMSKQMPEEIDHDLLLHLARACLCADGDEPHRGSQEAHTIYRWTELMSKEASYVRASPYAMESIPAGTPVSTPPIIFQRSDLVSPRPTRSWSRGSQLLLPISTGQENPLAMCRSPGAVQGAQSENGDWDAETVVFSPTSPSASSPLSDTEVDQCRPSGTREALMPPALRLVPPSSLPRQPATLLPPSPPDSTTFFDGDQKFIWPQHVSPDARPPSPPLPGNPETACGNVTKSACSPISVSEAGSFGIHSPLQSPSVSVLSGNKLSSPTCPVPQSPTMTQLEEYSRLLAESQTRQSALLEQMTELRDELAQLRTVDTGMRRLLMAFLSLFEHPTCIALGLLLVALRFMPSLVSQWSPWFGGGE